MLRLLLRAVACAALIQSTGLPPAWAQATTDAAGLLAKADLVGQGPVTAWRQGENLLLGVPPEALERPFLWYVEAVGVPAGVVADHIEVGTRLVQFERQGDRLFLRDLTVAHANRPAIPGDLPATAGPPDAGPETMRGLPGPEPLDDPAQGMPFGSEGAEPLQLSDPKHDPISAALSLVETGPILAAFPILGEQDGAVLIDVTPTFAGDVGGLSAGPFVAMAGLLPQGVDPTRSGIERVRLAEDTLVVRSGVTFLGANPADPAAGLSPVSLRLGHSLTFLPEEPMTPRYADPRVGFFTTSFTEFEEEGSGAAAEGRQVIARFRLERADPTAALSDPVEPITFWIGPGVPDRWRDAIRRGALMWNPVFEEAGFSNAIRTEQAPEGDDDWFVEDAGRNVIRWLPMNHENAMGPHVVDPRSGETLFSHVILWPGVMNFFSLYYYAVFGGVDPRAATLPLPLDLQQDILAYIVAHEVGHAIGLRHNHLASTAWSVEQMRDPDFANANGPNSSIMAYGRMNQAAQPGDGITQFWSVMGPYDRAAIRWGYGSFPDQAALDAFAGGMAAARATQWGAGEQLDEVAGEFFDPRVQMENTGAERIEATRLGTANTLRSLAHLPEATQDAAMLRAAYGVTLAIHGTLLMSVAKEIAGTMPRHEGDGGPAVTRVPAAEQSAAVAYLLGEGARTLEPFRDPAILERAAVFGGAQDVDLAQAGLVAEVLDGARIGLLDSQADLYPDAYSATDLGHDAAAAVWSDIGATNRTSRVLQQAWLDAHARLLGAWALAGATEAAAIAEAKAAGAPAATAAALVETGDDTLYPAWLRDELPGLQTRLNSAAIEAESDEDRLHYEAMAAGVAGLMAALH